MNKSTPKLKPSQIKDGKPFEFKGSFPLIEVSWVDSQSWSGWRSLEQTRANVIDRGRCRSIGWLISESDIAVALAQNLSIGDDGTIDNVGDVINIPKVSIVSQHEIVIK